MNAVIFSGTTEGRVLSGILAEDGADVDVFVATEYGCEEQGRMDGVRVHTGRKTAYEMQEAVRNADICIDATHPYALEATANICGACKREDIPYYRLKRGESATEGSGENLMIFGSVGEAAGWLREQPGNILITTGSKELALYKDVGTQRLYPRVLPVRESIEECERIGIPHRNIIAMQGPFSRQLNEAIIRQFNIEFIVTKESGRPGGFAEKIDAAAACGIMAAVIARPDEDGYSMDEIHEICRRME